MRNVAHQFCQDMGKTIASVRKEYDGACIDFAGDLIDHLGRGRVAYFETTLNLRWRYHAAVEIDGVIHDLWGNEPMPLAVFTKHIGACEVEYPAEQENPK